MKPHLRIRFQRLFYSFRFVCRQIVQNDMDFAGPFRRSEKIAQEVDEIGAGMPGGGLAHDLSGPHF